MGAKKGMEIKPKYYFPAWIREIFNHLTTLMVFWMLAFYVLAIGFEYLEHMKKKKKKRPSTVGDSES